MLTTQSVEKSYGVSARAVRNMMAGRMHRAAEELEGLNSPTSRIAALELRALARACSEGYEVTYADSDGKSYELP